MNKIFKVVFCKSTGAFVAVSENSKAKKKNTKSSSLCVVGKTAGFVLAALMGQQSFANYSILQGLDNINTSLSQTVIIGNSNKSIPLINGDGTSKNFNDINHTLIFGNQNVASGHNNTVMGANNGLVGNDNTTIGGTNFTNGDNNISLSSTRSTLSNNFSDPMMAIYISKSAVKNAQLAELSQLANSLTKLSKLEYEAELAKLLEQGVITAEDYQSIMKSGLTSFLAQFEGVAALAVDGITLTNTTVGDANITLGDANTTKGNLNTTTGTYNKTVGSYNTVNGLGNDVTGVGSIVLGVDNVAKGNENIVIGSNNSAAYSVISAKIAELTVKFNNGEISVAEFSQESEKLIAESVALTSNVNMIEGNNNTVLGKSNFVQGSSNKLIGDSGLVVGGQNVSMGDQINVAGGYNSVVGGNTIVKGYGNSVNAQALLKLGTVNSQTQASSTFFNKLAENDDANALMQFVELDFIYNQNVAGFINDLQGTDLSLSKEVMYSMILGDSTEFMNSELYAAIGKLTDEQNEELNQLMGSSSFDEFKNKYNSMLQQAEELAQTTGESKYQALLKIFDENGELDSIAQFEDVFQALAVKQSIVEGNQIVGLGAGINVTANDAVAIGTEATVSHDGSVALGAGSNATGATLSQEAFLVGGSATSELNIGGRRITGLSAGANDTDAVNVQQLKALAENVENNFNLLNERIDSTDKNLEDYQKSNDQKVNEIESGLDSTNKKVDELETGLESTNKKVGELEAGLGSTNDKVNDLAKELDSTNEKVDENITLTQDKLNELGDGLASVNDKVAEVEAGLTETNNKVNDLNNELEKTQGDLQASIENSVKYDQIDGETDYSKVVLQGEDGSRISNVANAQEDSDAVNLGQVKDLITSGSGVQYEKNEDGSISKDKVILGGDNGTIITNLGDGKIEAGSTDAINGDQLNSVYKNMSASLGGGASWDPESSTYTAPVYKLSTGDYQGVENAINALDAKDQVLEGKISNLEQSFTNQLNSTQQHIRKVEKRLSAGIAQALSMESAPYAAGKLSYALGAAHYNGEQAVGGTLRLTAENGKWSVITGVSGGSEGGAAFKIGMSGVFE